MFDLYPDYSKAWSHARSYYNLTNKYIHHEWTNEWMNEWVTDEQALMV